MLGLPLRFGRFPIPHVDPPTLRRRALFVVQAPLTSAVIVSEMTADHSLILPIMITALAATAVSRLVCPEGVYHALARRMLDRQQASSATVAPPPASPSATVPPAAP
jgi:hypothetical protein